MDFKYLIMCEGNNEFEIIRILLDANKLVFTRDDLLGLTPYQARQIHLSTQVQAHLNNYFGKIKVLRIGDKQNEKFKIPQKYKDKIIEVKKYCTKPELEMLLIIAENLENEFVKSKSADNPKTFCKQHISYNKKRYNNQTKFYTDFYGDRPELLVDNIKKYRQINGSHKKDEHYLEELLK